MYLISSFQWCTVYWTEMHSFTSRGVGKNIRVKNWSLDIVLHGAKVQKSEILDIESFSIQSYMVQKVHFFGDDRFFENTFQTLQKLLIGSLGSGRARWKGLSKPQLFVWDRLLDDLQGSFYLNILDIVLHGRGYPDHVTRYRRGCQTVFSWVE